ncbi:HEAT repeat domain-containing protein [Methanosarcina mazei]|uniref:CN hydrolase domain-containing protein n=1 Tax=Methanosarcina mazei TaxID=2209 RepID=A0A6C0VIL2_METMZ|nr:HEAT repeat domain-containing protein [Methanosarcina mazei]QIB91008.1 hypothetical protein FQU78_08020 [Methanosarcina mazei]
MIDQQKIHKQCFSKDQNERTDGLDQLNYNFFLLPDKQQAWNDIIILATESGINYQITNAISSAFPHMPDKQRAWNNLHKLINDENYRVKWNVVSALGNIFSYLPDKQCAWKNLIKLFFGQEKYFGYTLAESVGTAFFFMSDKQQAWDDLHKLTTAEDPKVRSKVIFAIERAFIHIPNKQQVWNDLHRLTNDEDPEVRSNVAHSIGQTFSYLLDKQQAWNDLHQLTNDEDPEVRSKVVFAINHSFFHIPNKQQAWNDLHRLTNDEDPKVRSSVAYSIGQTFSHLLDKQQAWNDLHQLTIDEDPEVRYNAASALCSSFSQIPDRQQAWNDLDRLANDDEHTVRMDVARELDSVLLRVLDKQRVFEYIHKLTTDEDNSVRTNATASLRRVFSQVPDKHQAWNDLHRLTNDEYITVRCNAVSAIGHVFSQLPDKTQAHKELIKLTNDEIKVVRAYANNSLGMVSIFNASQIEKDYKKELETALESFERAEEESCGEWNKPAKFNLPFFRFIHTIVFEKLEAKDKAAKYLKVARNIFGKSGNQELLFEAINNLANSLIEADNQNVGYLNGKNREICFYKNYFDCIAELLSNNEETAPFPIEAIRMGIQILNRNLKEILEETKEIKIKDGLEFEVLYVPVSKCEKEIVRVAAVQFDFRLSDTIFPPQIIDKEKTRRKILHILNIARYEGVDIVCLPELCLYEDWISDIEGMYKEVAIIAGSFYNEKKQNVCKSLFISGMDIPLQEKITPSPFEETGIINQKMVPGNKLYIYNTKLGKYSILICRDFINLRHHIRGKIDIIFVPSYNKAIKRFHEDANNHITNSAAYIVISNTSFYGGTSIFGRIRKEFNSELVEAGYKVSEDGLYKLCELNKGEEGLIIAELNLIHKSLQVPAPANPEEDIRPVSFIEKKIIKFPR